jgi:hypothetical protein
MQTRFFAFPDMETSFALAQAAGLTTMDEHNEPALVRFTNEYAIDVVGVISQPTGNMIEGLGGLFFPETAPIPGWHVNVRIMSGDPLPESFEQYEVFPATPSRDFA